MCANSLRIEYDEFSRPPVAPMLKMETGVFNPMTFYAFYIENKDEGGLMKPFTELFKGVYALIDARSSTQDASSPTKQSSCIMWPHSAGQGQAVPVPKLAKQMVHKSPDSSLSGCRVPWTVSSMVCWMCCPAPVASMSCAWARGGMYARGFRSGPPGRSRLSHVARSLMSQAGRRERPLARV